jgi:hypothetical protein
MSSGELLFGSEDVLNPSEDLAASTKDPKPYGYDISIAEFPAAIRRG